MITIEQLNVSYNKKQKVLDNLNLSLSQGDIHGIVGLNGSGKTTLLNTIYGLIKKDSGDIKSDEAKMSKKDISYLTAENFFYDNITGNEYLALFKNPNFNLEKWNQLFKLPLDQLIDNYSTGMKKKLAFLALLKQNKKSMILDEPFNGLDIETCRIIRSILIKLKEQNKTIIVTSHIIETLTNLCDHIHYLENGIIKFSKTESEFKVFETELFEAIENKNVNLINELTT